MRPLEHVDPTQPGKASLRQKLINATGADELLLEGAGNITPTDWSKDGRFIVCADRRSGNADLWVLPLFGDRRPFPLVQTTFEETLAAFAPDGRWIAYTTNEAGQRNVYVQAFPGTNERTQVSRDGGSQPVWRADGKKLSYLSVDGTLMAVPFDVTRQFPAGVPQALFRTAAPIFGRAGASMP